MDVKEVLLFFFCSCPLFTSIDLQFFLPLTSLLRFYRHGPYEKYILAFTLIMNNWCSKKTHPHYIWDISLDWKMRIRGREKRIIITWYLYWIESVILISLFFLLFYWYSIFEMMNVCVYLSSGIIDHDSSCKTKNSRLTDIYVKRKSTISKKKNRVSWKSFPFVLAS